MIIKLVQGDLLIQQASQLKSFQKSQLNLLGFKVNEEEYVCKFDKNILIKLLEYLQKYNIDFSLSTDLGSILKKILTENEDFRSVFDSAKSYKEGALKEEHKAIMNQIRKNTPRELKDHQVRSATHLYLSKNGANFSVPGSGKTSVVLSVYEKLRSEGVLDTLFVVGPPSCFFPWINEFEKTLGRKPRYKILAGGDPIKRKSQYFKKDVELILISFQTLLQDTREVELFMKIQSVKLFLVVDEAHYIKKINGNWASAILNIAKYAKYRCALTGTPMPQSYQDLYNLFDFLWPDKSPIDSSTKIKIKILESEKKFDEIKLILGEKIGPFFYRVKKSDLNLRPATFHEPFLIDMNKYEKLIYDFIEKRISNYSKEDYLKNIDLVRQLRKGRMIRLRQSVSYPHLLLTAIENYDENLLDDKNLANLIKHYDEYEKPAKYEYLLKLVNDIRRKGGKVVIWSNFIGTIKYIKKNFNNNEINSKAIFGEIPIEARSMKEEETREKIIEEFLQPQSGLDVLIANPAACAESISLHSSCHYAIYYDMSYNAAQFLQSLDRIHRVGGSESVDTHYYFLQYADTIDIDILDNLQLKAKKMSDLIDEDYNVYDLELNSGDDEEAFKRIFAK